jgi:hypothetical protein
VNDRSANAVSIKLGVVFFAVALSAPGALAETIGTANTVRPDVTGGGSTIQSGDGVSQGEVIKSGPSGSTKIGFSDGTSLSIGSSAQVTLSQFVFSDKKNFKNATFELGKGVFRFVTGNSDKNAYQIKTPTSTLSVRGTIFVVTVTDTSTTVKVEKGSVNFCQGANCQVVDAGQTAGDGASNSDPNSPLNLPSLTPPPPYTPNQDQCLNSNCISPH